MIPVSIVTISQFSRINFLKILAKCIKNQDYEHIKEWVIIDTSFVGYNRTEQDLTDLIDEFKLDTKLPHIVYYKSTKSKIGGWRNESSMLVLGDIIVCMDDDDYYPPQRVSHAVEKLRDKNTLIAGCDQMFFYDIYFKKFYQFKGFGQTHSTNNCMAYWREYLNEFKYDETIHNAEENSFTNNFSVPMTQLDPNKTVLQFSHNANTYDKKKIICMNFYLPPQMKYIFEKMTTAEKFISNDEIYQEYQKIFDELSKPEVSPYDIVYYTGFSPPWSPLQKDLGGSEQAIKYLTLEWSKKGKKVAIYGNFDWHGNLDGVEYIEYYKFRFWDKFEILILWRLHGCHPYLNFNLKSNKILVDIHDNIPEQYQLMLKNKDKITSWMVKSEFHNEVIETMTGQKIPNIVVVPNGTRIFDFSKEITESRNSYRMCYCSCYTRGLHRILKNIWPIIYKLEPRAELHTYYGMSLVEDLQYKEEMKQLLSQPGVMDHDRQPVEIINREKHLSTFQFYYTDSLAEIDCISIRESLVAGCIPIISNINLFKYRDGIHIQWFPNIPDFNHQIACGIIELMHNEQLQNYIRNENYKSKTITSWEQCADEWLKCM
jgi:hypothetical protein